AVKTVDKYVGVISDLMLKKDGYCLITADHGNAEEMTGRHQTCHTTNPVPFILVSNEKFRLKQGKNLSLSNVAPTILELMKIKKPKIMFGSLIKR
ncbi:2,3-bisphosphoglycerate-independent phosphoglycerate mutase, partial [Candidatus Woesearchaeota archaeon]|nr:2,3-bisphosphoglycerate-independent phosphoglycerate mutase [Candidatus Woesearchaeota archaeon]